jgi:hypothetical protein
MKKYVTEEQEWLNLTPVQRIVESAIQTLPNRRKRAET